MSHLGGARVTHLVAVEVAKWLSVDQVGGGGQVVVQVDVGGQAVEAHLGWGGHMAMSTWEVDKGGEGGHLGAVQVYMGGEWADMGGVMAQVGVGQAVGGKGEGGWVGVLGNGGRGWPEHWVGFHQGEEGREDRLQEREDVEGAQAHMGAGWSRKNMWGDVSRFGWNKHKRCARCSILCATQGGVRD